MEELGTFPKYDELVQSGTWEPRPNYVNPETALSYVITDADLDNTVSFVVRAKIEFQRRWDWSRNHYVKLKGGKEVDFPKSSDYRGVGVFNWGEKKLVVLTNSKADKDGKTLRLTTLNDPETFREIEMPKGYKFIDALLETKGPLRVLVEDQNKKRHLMVWVGGNQVGSWTDQGAAAFVLKNIKVLLNPRALKPDQVLNNVGILVAVLLLFGFIALRKS